MIPTWLIIPFAGLLLSIALGPILAPDWWDRHETHAVIFWSLLTLVLFTLRFNGYRTLTLVTDCLVNDYLTFIVLLFALYCVAGNISFEGDLAGSPRVNVFLLVTGSLLSSMIGTTGASMLMVRPVMKMNSWRHQRYHIMIFFIFTISNMGGCLTPVGDPPLLIGFMRGVPFTWSLRNFPILVLNLAVLMVIFYFIDRRAYRRDVAHGHRPDISRPRTTIKFDGLHNLIFLVMIVAAVLLSGILPGLKAFQTADGAVKGIHLLKDVTLTWPAVIELAMLLLAAWLSFRTTSPSVRRRNHMTWSAIQEVAVLFIGIFITMQPALLLLKAKGPDLGMSQTWQFFWSTGFLSSFLDNTPTYMVFLTTAGTLGFKTGIATALGTVPQALLQAISCGAVFMGAMTYIGNAPNFMVKTLAQENGINMPSFFGYMKWSLAVLLPVFLLDTLLFFH